MRVRSHTPRSITIVHSSVVWMLTFNWGGVINPTACWQPVLTTLVDEKAHVSAPCHVEIWEKRVLQNVMFRRERCAKKRSIIIVRDCPSTQSLTIKMCLFSSTRAPIIAVLCVMRQARGLNDWQRPRGMHRRAQSEARYLCSSVAAVQIF
jgi:hypothetical protein